MSGPNVEPEGLAVHHRGWQVFTGTRQDATRAVNAMVASSRVADRAMAAVGGQSRFLPEVYPGDEAAFETFNYRLTDARKHVREARGTLSAIVLPYAVAMYNDYVVDCLAVALLAGVKPPAERIIPGLANLHALLSAGPLSLDLSSRPQMVAFDLVRQLRNRAVHGAGIADAELVAARARLTADAPDAERDWARVARLPLPEYREGEPFTLGELDGRAALYVAGNAARDLNWQIWQAISRDLAADLLVAHYRTIAPGHGWSHDVRGKSVAVLAKNQYSALNLTADEQRAAIARSEGKAPPALGSVLKSLDAAAKASGRAADSKRADMARMIFAYGPTTELWLA